MLNLPDAADSARRGTGVEVIIPRQPGRRIGLDLRNVEQQLVHVFERVDLIELARVDDGHEEVTHLRPVPGLIEQGILAMLCRVPYYADTPWWSLLARVVWQAHTLHS